VRTFSGIGAADGIVVGKAHVWRKRGVELRRTTATGANASWLAWPKPSTPRSAN
jgi:hypothetical protein